MKFLLGFIFFGFIFFGCQTKKQEPHVTEYVNLFTETGEHRNCFLGATVPFGGIQLSPNNPHINRGGSSNNHYTDSIISAFSLIRLNGHDQGSHPDVHILPVISSPDSLQTPIQYIQSQYAHFSHKQEHAEPGYYRVIFRNGIKTELSTTPRCGIFFFQYPIHKIHALTLDLNATHNPNQTTKTYVRKINNRTLEGYREYNDSTKEQRLHFIMEFSQDCQIMVGQQNWQPLENGQKFFGRSCFLWIGFGNKTNKLLAKISISSANTEGAMANIEKELSHWSFDKVKRDAKQNWKRELQKIKVEGNDPIHLANFYTALYHAYLAPHIYSDVNGNYKGPDGEIHSVNKHVQYTVFSTYENYRALYPLFNITQKKRMKEIILSMLKHYDISSLPNEKLLGFENQSMLGNHAISVIAEAWMKGMRNFDIEKAYEAIKKTANNNRTDIKAFRTYHYIPYKLGHESISKTLAYAYDDWCIAQIAKELGKEEDYLHFLKSSRNYVHLFDQSAGFMRTKSVQGNWINLPNDESTQELSALLSWSVQHDIEGLIDLHGGKKSFVQKLDHFFATKQHDTKITHNTNNTLGQYVHHNTHSHHIPYLYNYVAQPQKTQFYIHQILTNLYQDSLENLYGDKNNGQLSAWYVFSAMGFYPVNPVEGKYQLGFPLFQEISIKTAPDKKFRIRANKDSKLHIYVKEILLNGKKLDRTWITHEEIMKGGELQFILTDRQSYTTI